MAVRCWESLPPPAQVGGECLHFRPRDREFNGLLRVLDSSHLPRGTHWTMNFQASELQRARDRPSSYGWDIEREVAMFCGLLSGQRVHECF